MMADGQFSLRGWDGVSSGLTLLAALIGGVVYLETSFGIFAPSPLPAANAAMATGAPARVAKGDSDDAPEVLDEDSVEGFEEILERPIFAQDRRPGATARTVASAASAPGLDRLKLAGMVRDGDRRLALLQGAAASEYYTVALGDALRGWKLVDVGGDRALFAKVGGESMKKTGEKTVSASRLVVDRDGARPPKAGE